MKFLQLCGCGISAPVLTRELRRLGHEVLLADADPVGKDVLKVLRPTEKEFYSTIKNLCKDLGVIVLPHNHTEAFEISKMDVRSLLPPTISLINTINKVKMYETMEKAGVRGVPEYKIWKGASLEFQEDGRTGYLRGMQTVIYKPVEGCGSQGLLDVKKIPEQYIQMERLRGPEYTIDAVCDKGKVVDWCVRERLKSHGGICVDAQILGRPEEIGLYLDRFVRLFHWSGPMALQGFYWEGKFTITDCNPRFGGGSGMSTLAGWKGVEQYCRVLESQEPLALDYEIKKIRVRRWYREEVI